MRSHQTIEIKCKSDYRPGDLIEKILEGTGLEVRKPVSTVLDQWEWDYSDVEEDRWRKANELIRHRIIDLYQKNIIEYGSW